MRFFRSCIGLKDDFYNRYIVKNRCFEPIVLQLRDNCLRDNLVHSAILELLEFVRRENIKILVAHLSDNYQQLFASLTHVDIFKGLLLRHEQNEEYNSTRANCGSGTGAQPAQLAGTRRAFPDDDDDDAYFNESDDDDVPQSAALADEDDRAFTPRQHIADDQGEEASNRLMHRRPPSMELPALGSLHRGHDQQPPSQHGVPVVANALGCLASEGNEGGVESAGDDSSRKRRRVEPEPEITD